MATPNWPPGSYQWKKLGEALLNSPRLIFSRPGVEWFWISAKEKDNMASPYTDFATLLPWTSAKEKDNMGQDYRAVDELAAQVAQFNLGDETLPKRLLGHIRSLTARAASPWDIGDLQEYTGHHPEQARIGDDFLDRVRLRGRGVNKASGHLFSLGYLRTLADRLGSVSAQAQRAELETKGKIAELERAQRSTEALRGANARLAEELEREKVSRRGWEKVAVEKQGEVARLLGRVDKLQSELVKQKEDKPKATHQAGLTDFGSFVREADVEGIVKSVAFVFGDNPFRGIYEVELAEATFPYDPKRFDAARNRRIEFNKRLEGLSGFRDLYKAVALPDGRDKAGSVFYTYEAV